MGTAPSECPHPEFWTDMSNELFVNVCTMHEIIDTYFTLRVENEGTPAILVSGFGAPSRCLYLLMRLERYSAFMSAGLLPLTCGNILSVCSSD
jgi:hypothetical protein